MEIFPLTAETISLLDPLLNAHLASPFAIYGVPHDKFTKYVHHQLLEILEKGGFVLAAQLENEIVGFASLISSDWDSKLFGFPISKLNHLVAAGNYLEQLNIKRRLISEILKKCSKELLLHVSARVNKEDLSSIHALEADRFKLMDVLVTYSIDFRKDQFTQKKNSYNIRKFRLDEVPKLAKIACESFENTALATDRFHADDTLPKDKSTELYAKWLENSCKNRSGQVFVAEDNGTPIGFNICNLNRSLSDIIGLSIGTMALTAVDCSYRNKSVATSLLSGSLSWFADKQVEVVETGGQVSNYAIQRAWSSAGLKIVRSQCTFHWSVLTESLQ